MAPMLQGPPITDVVPLLKVSVLKLERIRPITDNPGQPVPPDPLDQERSFSLREHAERAAKQAVLAESRTAAFLWAETAIREFDQLGDETRAMAVRANLILRFGPAAGQLNDPKPVLDWLAKAIPWTTDDTLTRAATWKGRSRDEIRILREIKNRLALVAEFAKVHPSVVDREIERLLASRQRLP